MDLFTLVLQASDTDLVGSKIPEMTSNMTVPSIPSDKKQVITVERKGTEVFVEGIQNASVDSLDEEEEEAEDDTDEEEDEDVDEIHNEAAKTKEKSNQNKETQLEEPIMTTGENNDTHPNYENSNSTSEITNKKKGKYLFLSEMKYNYYINYFTEALEFFRIVSEENF